MSTQRILSTLAVTAALTLGSLAVPTPAAAHCDSLNGPVVEAARRALESGRVELALVWVKQEDEEEIRESFGQTVRARAQGGEARTVADRWFFETLVRVHRRGEGAPYTGLKPAGYEAPSGIEAADRALEDGSLGGLESQLAEHVAAALRERFDHVEHLRRVAAADPMDVEAGRAYVHAYVEYIHFVEKLYGLLHGAGDEHGAAASDAPAHGH